MPKHDMPKREVSPSPDIQGVLLCTLSLTVSLLALGACNNSEIEGDVWRGISAKLRTKAKRIYEVRCANCHGDTGAGDGPDANKTNPPPRSFRDMKWQKSISNATIEKSILGGGAATGKSVKMPPNPDLRDRLELVEAMRAYVRSLRN
ncbi:MAG: cytochrome c [Deltaproteobacteria bacterium]|nr:cytochrome c [Deltaproteobacteria bacterium]